MTKTFEKELKARIDGKAKPFGALGRIERLAAQIARLQGRLDPVMQDGVLAVFGSDHGIAEENVSAFPAAEPQRMLTRMATGGAAARVFAQQTGLALRVVDCGVVGGPFDIPGVDCLRIGNGTKSFLHGPAMTADQVDQAIALGQTFGAQGKCHAIGFGEMARGSSSSATLLVHKLTGAAMKGLIGRGAGLDEDGLFRKHDILTAASARVTKSLSPMDALIQFGGFEIAMMAGAMIGAAQAKRIVMVDGYVSGAAALVAAQIEPNCRSAMVFSHVSREPGHPVILDAMAAQPLLWLDMASGEGAGVALAWPILQAACAMLTDMAEQDPA